MTFLRTQIAPLLIVLTFLFAMVAVSIRSFLPGDLAAPAPLGEEVAPAAIAPVAGELPPAVSSLLHGAPDFTSQLPS